MPQRRLFFVGFIMLMVVTSLACSIGGDAGQPNNPAPQPSAVVVVVTQIVPVQPTSNVAQSTQSPNVSQPTITSQPAATEQPSATPIIGTGPGGCVLNMAFINETIPDNTVMTPGQAFVKSWTVKNTGTCTWDAGYQFVFADGTQMNGPVSVPINNTAPGANVSVAVNLKAPAAPGTYTGKWRFKASNNVIFGGNYTVVIIVPAPTPTITPTTVPVGAWGGHWETNCGTYACSTMDLVQTGNTVAGTYTSAGSSGTINGTVSGNRLHGTWIHSGGSGTIDWWFNNAQTKWRGNWDSTNGWCGHRTGDSDPAPCGVGTFNGNWVDQCGTGSCNGLVHIEQNGQNFTGTYYDGSRTIDGTIDGNTLTGKWHAGTNSGAIQWFLLNQNQFNGHYIDADGTTRYRWCAYRQGSGATLPATCDAP